MKLQKSVIDRFGSTVHIPSSCLISIYGSKTPQGTKPLNHLVYIKGVMCDAEKIFIIRSFYKICDVPNVSAQSSSQSPRNENTDELASDDLPQLIGIVQKKFSTI